MILSKELQEKWGLVHVFFCFYKASWRNSSVARWGSTSDNFGLYIYFLEIWFWNIFFKNRRYVEVHKRFDVVVTRKTDWYKQLLRISRKVGGNVKRGLLPIFVNKPPLFPFHIWLGETRRKSFSRPPTFAETSRSCGFPRLEANVFSTRAVHLHTYGIKIYKTTPYLSAQLELVAVWTRFSISREGRVTQFRLTIRDLQLNQLIRNQVERHGAITTSPSCSWVVTFRPSIVIRSCVWRERKRRRDFCPSVSVDAAGRLWMYWITTSSRLQSLVPALFVCIHFVQKKTSRDRNFGSHHASVSRRIFPRLLR